MISKEKLMLCADKLTIVLCLYLTTLVFEMINLENVHYSILLE